MESIDEYGKTFMSINSSSFTANTASRNASGATFATLSGSGGALRLFVAVLWVDGTSFQSNYASNVGGAIFFLQSCIPVRRPHCSMQMACISIIPLSGPP